MGDTKRAYSRSELTRISTNLTSQRRVLKLVHQGTAPGRGRSLISTTVLFRLQMVSPKRYASHCWVPADAERLWRKLPTAARSKHRLLRSVDQVERNLLVQRTTALYNSLNSEAPPVRNLNLYYCYVGSTEPVLPSTYLFGCSFLTKWLGYFSVFRLPDGYHGACTCLSAHVQGGLKSCAFFNTPYLWNRSR